MLMFNVLPLHLGNCLPSAVITVAVIPLHFFLHREKHQHVSTLFLFSPPGIRHRRSRAIAYDIKSVAFHVCVIHPPPNVCAVRLAKWHHRNLNLFFMISFCCLFINLKSGSLSGSVNTGIHNHTVAECEWVGANQTDIGGEVDVRWLWGDRQRAHRQMDRLPKPPAAPLHREYSLCLDVSWEYASMFALQYCVACVFVVEREIQLT